MPISDYIRHLRQKIGTELLLLPSVTVLVRDDTGRLLIVRHSDTGLWGLIGGAVEVDESPAEAARREAKEEVDLEVELTRLIGVLGGPRFRFDYPNGDQVAYVSAVYDARPVSGTPRPDHSETSEVLWVTREEIKSLQLNSFAVATLEEVGAELWR